MEATLPVPTQGQTGQLTFRQAWLLEPRPKRRHVTTHVTPNFHDRLARRLQTDMLVDRWPDVAERFVGRDADLEYHVGAVTAFKKQVGLNAANILIPGLRTTRGEGVALAAGRWFEKWLRCGPVGTGTRHGQRCYARFCPNCAALRAIQLRRAIIERTCGNQNGQKVCFLRIAREQVYVPSTIKPEDADVMLQEAVILLRKAAVAAIKLLGEAVTNAAVVTRVDEVRPWIFAPSGNCHGGVAVSLSVSVVFLAERAPVAAFRSQWPHAIVPATKTAVAKRLDRMLRVTPGLFGVPIGTFYALQTGLRKLRTIDFRGQWRHDEFASRTSSVAAATVAAASPTVTCSPASILLLDLLKAPTNWADGCGIRHVTLGWMSSTVVGRDGALMPIRLAESVERIEPAALLDDGLVDRLMLPHMVAGNPRPTGVVWQAAKGRYFVCYPAALEEGVAVSAGNRTCLCVRFGRETYYVTPLESPRFVQAVWAKWQVPWAMKNAKRPVYAAVRRMNVSLAAEMMAGRYMPDRIGGGQANEETRAVIELYKGIGHGRAEAQMQLGLSWHLSDASFQSLGRRVLFAMYRCHGQCLADLFRWSSGIVAAQLSRLPSLAPGVYAESTFGVVFNLYRERAVPGRTRRWRRRVILHNDAPLVGADHHGVAAAKAKVIARVTVELNGQPTDAFLQDTASFYRCIRERHPEYLNVEPVDPKDQWRPEVEVRAHLRHRNMIAACQRAVDSVRADAELAEALAVIRRSRASPESVAP